MRYRKPVIMSSILPPLLFTLTDSLTNEWSKRGSGWVSEGVPAKTYLRKGKSSSFSSSSFSSSSFSSFSFSSVFFSSSSFFSSSFWPAQVHSNLL